MPADPELQPVMRALGVTRLARVTTLDRTQVEVFAAIRPNGHVLQVTHGKGETPSAAQWSALGEAAELHAAENPDPNQLVFCSAGQLDGLILDDDGISRAWTRGRRLSDQAPVWVPAERVYCPPAGVVWLGPSVASWTSNGFGAHRTPAAASSHAVLEAWERHALAQLLPDGWTPDVVAQRLVKWSCERARAVEAQGFVVAPFVLAVRPLPLAAVLLFDTAEPDIPLTAGYACRRTVDGALTAAFLEAAQSRSTEIHGARDDVAVGKRSEGETLLELVRKTKAARVPRVAPGGFHSFARRVVLVSVAHSPLVVVKAVGLNFEASELLR